MRRLVTWLLVAALIAIGLFAARDTLRSGRASPATPPLRNLGPHPSPLAGPPAIPGRADAAGRLRSLGASGALYLTDSTCRRFVLTLPGLHWTTPSGLPGTDCGFWARPPLEGSGIAARQVNSETIEVTSGGWSYGFEGSSPAFKPNGTLTFVRDGGLYEWTARCPATAKIIEFEGLRTIPRCVHRIEPAPARMQDVAWLTDRDFAAIAGPRRGPSLLVVRGGDQRTVFTRAGATMGALEASPRGRFLAARVDGTLALFRPGASGKSSLPQPGDRLVRTVAWSPDERVAALATDRSIEFIQVSRRGQVVDLPLSVIALQWR
jgi:hypothetical protein